MTAKEKVKELVNNFWDEGLSDRQAKQCALICVDEIIDVCNVLEPWLGLEYWQEVKKEIELL